MSAASGLKVLHVLPWSGLGGTERQAASLVSYAPPGVICYHAMPPGPGKDLLLSAGSLESGIPMPYPLPIRGFLGVVRLIHDFVARSGIDIVHIHGSREFAYFLGKGKVKAIFTPHAYASWADLYAVRISGARVHKVICLTNIEADSLAGLGLDRNRIAVVPNGVVIPPIDAMVPRRKAHRNGKAIVGALSRLSKDKGLDGVIKAVSMLRQRDGIIVRIAGDGPEKESLSTLADSLGVNLELVGPVSDTWSFLSSLDIFALPSMRETFGLAVVEAMAMGLPVVTTPVGVMGEAIVSGHTGILVPIGDSIATSEALNHLLSSEGIRHAIGVAARDRAESLYSMERCAEMTYGVYTDPS